MATENNKNVAKGKAFEISPDNTPAKKSYGTIKGVIVDKKTQKRLSDANVILQGFRRGAATNQNGDQAGCYLSSRFQILYPLILETGIRYDYTSYSNDKLWSPRISMVYSLAKATFLRAGWGYYYQTQGIHELRVQFKENFYHPAELAKHYVLGFEHFFNNGIHFRAEGYVKQMINVPPAYYTFANIDEFFPEARVDLIQLSIDKATAKGIELYLKYDTGNKFSWWLSYVLADAKDDVKSLQYTGRLIKQTGVLPRPWDQRHTINIDMNY